MFYIIAVSCHSVLNNKICFARYFDDTNKTFDVIGMCAVEYGSGES